MYVGSLAPVSNREDWVAVSPLVDEDDEEVTLTGATFEMFVCPQGCSDNPVLSGSTDDGKITLPSTTTFQWAYTPDDMSVLRPGTYDVFLRVTIAGVVTQILSASVPIIDGGPSS